MASPEAPPTTAQVSRPEGGHVLTYSADLPCLTWSREQGAGRCARRKALSRLLSHGNELRPLQVCKWGLGKLVSSP